jgi:hypothetical protein
VANEYTDLIEKINKAARSDRNLRIALTSTLSVHKPRIFQQGFDSKGSKIGTYSSKPASISRKQQARDTGRSFFKGGYAEYKRAVGKNPGYVILRNTDQMYMDYGIQGSGLNYGFGFQNSENYNKSQWMQEKYHKDIFDISRNEEKVLTEVLTELFIQSIR